MCRPGRWWQPNAHHKPGWLVGNHPGKKAFTFIAPLGCLRLPLLWWYWLRRFYSELQNTGDQKTSVSGGYLTDPLYLSRLKGLLRIIIQSQISRVLINSLLSRRLKWGPKWEMTEDGGRKTTSGKTSSHAAATHLMEGTKM